MLSYQSKVVQFKVGWVASKCMISKSCLFFFIFCENHFLLNLHFSLNLFLQSRSKFQTSLRRYIFPLLVRDSIFANFARKIAVRVRKCHLSSFWRGSDNLLGHLDRGTSLGETLEPFESVVYENPVLVRLTRVRIWRSGWKWESQTWMWKNFTFWERKWKGKNLNGT